MLTAVYDGHCVICNTTRRTVTALDWFNRVEWLDLHRREEVEGRYPFLDYDRAMGEIHVIDRAGQVYGGFHAMRRMMRELPLGWPLYVLMRLPLVGGWMGPRVYRFIARHRYRINKLLGVDLEQMEREEAMCDENVCKLPH